MGRQALPATLVLIDDLVVVVGEPIKSAVAKDEIVEEAQPLVDRPI